MENIQVILCGTDAFQVESVLQGTVEKEHYAWNKKYRFSCTHVLSIDKVDSRLLLVCHIVILCKGCRSPRDKTAYNGRPVLSLPDATPACVEEIRDCEYYYGPTELSELRSAAVSIALAPPHVVYDSLLQCLTPLGEAAFRRAFWLLDKNNDGTLSKEELLSWTHLTRSAAFSEADLRELLSSVESVTGPSPQAQLTQAQFNELHRHWLEVGSTESAWATLHAVGTHTDGLPYSWHDLHSMRVDRDVNTYLSSHAIQFFRNVYKLKNFRDCSDGAMWSFTPGCPWTHIDGFSSTGGIVLDRFVEYWKYMALERREDVIIYARYWGYKGDAGFLFVQRSARAARSADEQLPNTLQVLVVGTEACGRKSLIFQLTSDGKESFQPRDDATIYVRTTTFYAEKAGGSGGVLEEPQTIVYTTIKSEKAEIILTNESLNRTFDIVLLCVDCADYQESSRYAMSLYERTAASGNCPHMPFLLVMTKSDVLDGGALPDASAPADFSKGAGHSSLPSRLVSVSPFRGNRTAAPATLESFATTHRLLWPPVMASTLRSEESEIAVLNEYMYTVARNPELAVGKAPLTWVKLLRRGTFTAIVVVGTIALFQKIGQWAVSLRKRE